MKFRVSILFCVILFIVFLHYHNAYASSQSTNDLITVTPSYLLLDLQTDQPQVEYYYRNDTPHTIEIRLWATDFKPLEDGYKISFLQGKDAENYQYRLSSWITFEKNTLIISPHSSEAVKIFINKNELTPGSHYATIMANLSAAEPKGDVSIQGVLSSFLFVRTNTGKETEEATIASLFPLQDFFDFPKAISLRFFNTGNTELIPHGTAQITDFFGNTIGTGIINDASSLTLPESIKRYTIPIHTTTSFLLPGIYTMHVQLHYGKVKKILTKDQLFFSLGSLVITLVILVVCGVILFLPLFLLRKKHKH